MPHKIIIVHFDSTNLKLGFDDEPMFGWYYLTSLKNIENDDDLQELISRNIYNYHPDDFFGPYSTQDECLEQAKLEFRIK